MPRKPTRRRYSSACRPLAFSPFARSLAQLKSANKLKHLIEESKLKEYDPPGSLGNGVPDSNGEEKKELSDSSDDEEFQGQVQADFLFFNPKPDDFHGVKLLLQNYLDNKQWDISGFVDLILGQPSVGSVVKIEGDEDEGVYSVVTALNVGRYKESKCMMEVKEFLLTACQDNDIIPNLRSLLEGNAEDVALLVSQRVVNLPLQLLPPLYKFLFEEISLASKNEPIQGRHKSFCFKFYLLVGKIYKHKNLDKKRGSYKSGGEAIIYIKPEDEIFHELCSWSFTFPLHKQQVSTNELKDYRLMGLVMAIEATKISRFQEQLDSLIDES